MTTLTPLAVHSVPLRFRNILGGDKRVRSCYKSSNNAVPPLYGLRKYHKTFDNEEVGPPTRQVCGSVVASNRRISQFLSSVLRPIIEQAEEVCESTEDMLSRIQHCNETEMLSSSVVGSMDVKALYPSIDIDFAVEKCVELMQESNVKFNNVHVDELG